MTGEANDRGPSLADALDATIDGRRDAAAVAAIEAAVLTSGPEAGLAVLRAVRIDRKLVHSVRAESDDERLRRLLVDDVRRPRAETSGRSGRRAASMAAATAICLLVAVATLFTTGRPAAEVGRVVAVSEGATFGAEAVEVDDVVRAGRVFDLVSGFATVELGDGVAVDLVGPVRARCEVDGSVRLDRGLLAGTVGPAGRGFTVRTEDAEVVDLGTRFQIHKDFTHGTRVRVTEGRVEAKLLDAAGGASKVVDLLAGQTLRLDRGSGTVDSLAALFDFDGMYGPVTAAKGAVRRFSGAAKPLSGPIVGLDLRSGRTLTRGDVFVIPERSGVTLERPLEVATDGRIVTLPVGTVVDSYLFHFDIGEGRIVDATGDGAITLDGDVLAVAADAASLAVTDPVFGFAGVRFGDDVHRGVEAGREEVTVSTDRRTVTFDLNAEVGRAIDQFRVLVMGTPVGSGDGP